MVENRFSEFFEPAKSFTAFIEARNKFLQPYYMNTYLALREDDIPDNFAAFLGFDIIGCLQNLDFYKTKELIPFKGKVDPAAIEALLNIGRKTSSPYFRGLRALALWHYKRLARVDFTPEKINPGHHHPGKILSLWRSKAG